ncbi:MAG: glycosyltransferase [Pseudorhodobacter sp.]
MARTLLTVILNWRTAEMTLRATAAARAAMKDLPGAITIVDNDSGDGSFERMSAEIEARGWDRGEIPVRVLQSGHNGGFGAGNNYGIRAGLPEGVRPDYVYILNSDAFPEPDAIRALYQRLETHPETGFAGSYIKGEDGLPHQTAFRFPSIASEFEGSICFGPISRLLRRHIVPLPVPEETRRVDWLAGASLMMRQDLLDRIGLFDETFFLYFEETELCQRVARAEMKIDYVRESEVVHIGSASTGMKTWRRMPSYWFDSRLYYFTKTRGRLYAFLATLALITGAGLWRLRMLIQRKDSVDPPKFLRDLIAHSLRAVMPGGRGRPSKPKRAQIQREGV